MNMDSTDMQATNEFPNKNILQDNFYINDVLKKMKLIKKRIFHRLYFGTN